MYLYIYLGIEVFKFDKQFSGKHCATLDMDTFICLCDDYQTGKWRKIVSGKSLMHVPRLRLDNISPLHSLVSINILVQTTFLCDILHNNGT